MRAGAVLLVVALAAALSVDVVKTGFGIKGDEATCVSMYAVFLAPEILHFAIIFFAYFLWLYKEVKPDAPAWLRGRGSDVAAVILLGAATYSKPPNHALLVAPIVFWFWWRRHWL